MSVDAVSAAIDAIYVFASDPDNWEELAGLLAEYANAGDNPEHQALLLALEDHAKRAEDIALRLHPATELAAKEPVAKPVDVGWICFAANGCVTELSPEGAKALQSFCSEPLQPGKAPAFQAAENARHMRQAMERILTVTGSPGGPPDLLRLSGADSKERVVGFVTSFKSAPADIQAQLSERTHRPRGKEKHGNDQSVALLMMPSGQQRTQNAQTFQEVLGLSPAEARLAFELRNGQTLKEAAASLGISANTARNQLHSTFDRLGVNRQVDLIRHLTEMINIAAMLDSASVPEATACGFVDDQPPHRLIDLPDGRRLAYREFGKAGGNPVVLMPSSLRSSLGWPPESIAADELGVRLIIPERPGIGLSDPDPEMTAESVAADTAFLVDALDLKTFALSARSSGAPFALATAALMGQRVTKLVLAAPRLGVPHSQDNRPAMMDYFFGGLRRHPWLLKSAVSILRAKLSRKIMEQLALHFFEKSPVDHKLLQADKAVMDNSVDAATESLLQSHEGLFRESQLFLDGIQLDLGNLTAPIEVWQGVDDGITPVEETKAHLEAQGIKPVVHHLLVDQGHLFVVRYCKELLESAIRP